MMAVGLMADRYQVEAVQGAVEDAVLKLMTVDSCGMLLACSSGSGLVRVELASRELALREFDEFSKTAGFMALGEEALGSLLDDDGLTTEKEERVYEGLVRWMKGGGGEGVRGEGLLRKMVFYSPVRGPATGGSCRESTKPCSCRSFLFYGNRFIGCLSKVLYRRLVISAETC
jgi:hypothetical protein